VAELEWGLMDRSAVVTVWRDMLIVIGDRRRRGDFRYPNGYTLLDKKGGVNVNVDLFVHNFMDGDGPMAYSYCQESRVPASEGTSLKPFPD
jgi:hypothetical protein